MSQNLYPFDASDDACLYAGTGVQCMLQAWLLAWQIQLDIKSC